MTQFIIFAGLLVAGALLFVLPPLLGAGARKRREKMQQSAVALTVLREQLAELDADLASGQIDAEAHARSRAELERRALEEGEAAADAADATDHRPRRAWAVGMALAVPALAVAGYLWIGEPDALDPAKVAGQQGFSHQQVADMVNTLEARLAQEPNNEQGWMMLARTYMVLQDFPKAVSAFERLDALRPNDPDVLADWADVLAAVRGSVAGEAEALAQKALAVAPEHPKALALAGTGAFQRADYSAAAALWERILVQIPAGEAVRDSVLANVNEARSRAGLPALAAAPLPPVAADAPLTVAGRLELAGALAGKVTPDDVVFVFVRGDAGGPPLAALRFKAGELPLAFDFAGAMMMGAGQAVPAQVVVAARVAKGGDVKAAPGDLEGASAPVARDARGVRVVIDRVRE